jgi:replicative DNA helicase
MNNDKRVELERSILGTLIINPKKIFEIQGRVMPAMFSGHHRSIADQIWDRHSKAQKYDDRVLIASCPDVPPIYISELSNAYTNQVGEIGEALRNEWLRDQHMELYKSGQSELTVNEGPPADVALRIAEQSRQLIESTTDNTADEQRPFLAVYENFIAPPGPLSGISTGVSKFDRETGGWQPGHFVLIGARPGMGKTTLMLFHTIQALQAGYPVAVFSLEMDAEKLIEIMACLVLGYDPEQRRKFNEAMRKEVAETSLQLYDMGLRVFDTQKLRGNTTVENIALNALMAIHANGAQMVVIDYIQLMRTAKEFKNGNAEMEYISRHLMATAQTSAKPFIVGSQLSRAVEIRGGTKRATLADLRQSGSLEQDAHMVILPYRPEYYNILEDQEGQSLRGLMEWNIAKYRPAGYILNMNFGLRKTGDGRLVDQDFADQVFEPDKHIEPAKMNDDKDIPF